MSLSTIVGFLFGVALFIFSIVISTDNYVSFLSLSSLLMVLGGTLAAAFISYQSRYVILALKGIGLIFKAPKVTRGDLNTEIMQLIKWAYVLQKKGLKDLEKELSGAKLGNPLLDFGVQLVATGYKEEQVRDMLDTAVEANYERETVPVTVLKNMASAAPAFGMIGTLVGLVVMLQGLGEDMSQLGTGLAVALLTTLYGVIFARMIFLPAATKLEQHEQINRFRNFLTTEGLVMLAAKESPRYMQDRLNSFLDPAIHFDIDKQLSGS